jgi:arsenite methyltransferase
VFSVKVSQITPSSQNRHQENPFMRTTIVLVVMTLVSACHFGGHHHGQRSVAEWERILENPSRDAWQRPAEVVAAMRLRADEVVADIGAGTGYFTRRFAPVVQTVYAVDLDPELLAVITRGKSPNVVTVHAARDDPRLPAATVDTIFICDVLHHIANRPAYYAKLNQALRANGRILIVDFHKRDLPVGPPAAMKLAEQEVIDELARAGFRLSQRFDVLPYQYMLEFKR